MKYFILIPALIVFVDLPLMLLRAFVVVKMWLWFVVPFFGQKELPLVIALGLMVLINLFIPYQDNEKKESLSSKIAGAISASVVKSLFALGMGWLIQLFL